MPAMAFITLFFGTALAAGVWFAFALRTATKIYLLLR